MRRTRRQALADLDPADCRRGRRVDDHALCGDDWKTSKRFARLRAIVRMGVGYDKIARPAAAARNILVCNVPDYGTTEVADHAIALALIIAPRRHPLSRAPAAEPAGALGAGQGRADPPPRRADLRHHRARPDRHCGRRCAPRAFGFRVMFYDPYLPNGAELRARRRPRAQPRRFLRQTDTLSVHTPLTPGNPGPARPCRARAAAQGRSGGQYRARPDHRPRRAVGRCCASGHIAAAGLDVLPVEPLGRADP